MSTGGNGENLQRRRKRRWGDATQATEAEVPAAPTPTATATATTAPALIDSKAKALALQQSIRARLEALKAKNVALAPPVPASVSAVSTMSVAPPSVTETVKRPSTSSSVAPSAKRAKHYELDLNITGPTFKQEPPKPKVNPYLAHQIQEEPDQASAVNHEEDMIIVDDRVQASKLRKRHKPIQFIEPGTFVEIAERKRRKAANAEQSGFVSGRKAGTYVTQQTMMANIYGSTEVQEDDTFVAVRPEANEKTSMPQVVEWWDMELLPSKLKKQVAVYEGNILQQETQSQLHHILESKQAVRQLEVLENQDGQNLQTKCLEQAALSYSRTAALIQHIIPIKPPHIKGDEPPVVPTLYLTKKELKRQRKLRRQDKQRELQDLQAAGLVPAPEPRLTLQNFIRVLGDQAYVDPSQMEQKVMAQMEARQRAHMQRNEAAKLTKEQRAAKLERKLYEDTTKTGLHVALFYVKDLSHPYHRTKLDLNAQQNNITGGVLECQAPQLACVICEGGPKAIKRYIRLMTVRMKWKGVDNAIDEDDDDDDDEEDNGKYEEGRPKFNSDNTCELVWTGMATKRFFKGFVFQACESGMEAAKILRAKGVGHFWDQLLTHASGKSDKFQLKLVESDVHDDDNDDDDSMRGGDAQLAADGEGEAMEEQ